MRYLLLAWLLWAAWGLSAQDGKAPFSYWLRGDIGKRAIEMRLSLDFDRVGEPCASVRGCYYEQGLRAVELTGKYWYKDKKMELSGKNHDGEQEDFSFSFFDGSKGSGEWRMAELLREVHLTAITAADKLAFLEGAKAAMPDIGLLGEQKISLEKPADLPEYFSWEIEEYARGGYIVLDFEEEYVSSRLIFALLSESPMRAICVEHMNAYTPSFDEEGKQIPSYSTSLRYEIWGYDGAKKSWKMLDNETLGAADSADPVERIFEVQVGAWGIYAEQGNAEGGPKPLFWRWDGKKMVKKQ